MGVGLRDYQDEHRLVGTFLRGGNRGTTSAPCSYRAAQLRPGPHPAGSPPRPAAPFTASAPVGRAGLLPACLLRPARSGEAALLTPSRAARRHQALKPRRLRGLGCHGGGTGTGTGPERPRPPGCAGGSEDDGERASAPLWALTEGRRPAGLRRLQGTVEEAGSGRGGRGGVPFGTRAGDPEPQRLPRLPRGSGPRLSPALPRRPPGR